MSGPADTWLGVLLSGLVGSVIGGAVTFIALWWTLRHERHVREDDRLDHAVATTYSAAYELLQVLPPEGQSRSRFPDERMLTAHWRYVAEANMLIALARTRAPALAAAIASTISAFLEHDESWAENRAAVKAAIARLEAWRRNPEGFAAMNAHFAKRRASQG